jgi:hypothetical protein
MHERPLLAGDCLLAQLIEGLLWRKVPLKSYTSAAEFGPRRALKIKNSLKTTRFKYFIKPGMW